MTMNVIKNKFGFSLVEVLVTMLIFSFVAAGLFTTAAVGDNSWQVNHVRVELQQELRKAMEWMKYDLQQAGAGSITNVPADGVAYSTITFRTPAGVSGVSLAWNDDTIQYVLGGSSNNQLQKIEGEDTKILAQNIQSIAFTRAVASSNILDVTMQGQKTPVKHNTPVSYDLNFQVQLRN